MKAQRESTDIALLIHNHGASRGWMVAMAWPLYPWKTDLVSLVQEAGLASGPVWMGTEDLAIEPWTIQLIASHYTNI